MSEILRQRFLYFKNRPHIPRSISVCHFAGSGIKLDDIHIPATQVEITEPPDKQPTRNAHILPYWDPSNRVRT